MGVLIRGGDILERAASVTTVVLDRPGRSPAGCRRSPRASRPDSGFGTSACAKRPAGRLRRDTRVGSFFVSLPPQSRTRSIRWRRRSCAPQTPRGWPGRFPAARRRTAKVTRAQMGTARTGPADWRLCHWPPRRGHPRPRRARHRGRPPGRRGQRGADAPVGRGRRVAGRRPGTVDGARSDAHVRRVRLLARGVVALADTPRPEARAAIARLHAMGRGSHAHRRQRGHAQAIAKEVAPNGEIARVVAGVLPGRKADE